MNTHSLEQKFMDITDSDSEIHKITESLIGDLANPVQCLDLIADRAIYIYHFEPLHELELEEGEIEYVFREYSTYYILGLLDGHRSHLKSRYRKSSIVALLLFFALILSSIFH